MLVDELEDPRCQILSRRTPVRALDTVAATAAAEAAGASGDGDEASASTAASASPTASVRMSGFNIRCPALPLSVRMTTVSKDGFDQPNRMELLGPVLGESPSPRIPRSRTEESSTILLNRKYSGRVSARRRFYRARNARTITRTWPFFAFVHATVHFAWPPGRRQRHRFGDLCLAMKA